MMRQKNGVTKKEQQAPTSSPPPLTIVLYDFNTNCLMLTELSLKHFHSTAVDKARVKLNISQDFFFNFPLKTAIYKKEHYFGQLLKSSSNIKQTNKYESLKT